MEIRPVKKKVLYIIRMDVGEILDIKFPHQRRILINAEKDKAVIQLCSADNVFIKRNMASKLELLK